jgi:hypothetical protein
MLNINLQSRFSTIVIGILIFFIPFFTFLSPENLKQISGSEVFEIFLSLIFFLFFIFISSFSLELLSKLLFKKKIILFPFLCLAFYVIFLYIPYSTFLQEFLIKIFGESVMDPHNTFLTLSPLEGGFILFGLFCISLIVLGAKFNSFSLRAILIFSIFMMINALIPLVGYLIENTKINQAMSYEIKSSSLAQDKTLIKRNIYYIILDGMLALDPAQNLSIATKQDIIDNLSNSKLKYIDQSRSSYSGTYLTLASIMLMDYPVKPSSPKYFNTKNFFPRMMVQKKTELPLISLLNRSNSSFFWSGNSWASCKSSNQWTCINSSYELVTRNLLMFYSSTPLLVIYNRIFNSFNLSSIDKFLNYIDKNGKPKTPFFAFIHHFSPHSPFLVTNECGPTHSSKYFNRSFEGYKSSYNCVLKTIEMFMEKINILDPEAIVVFQGDHGWLNDKSHLLGSDLEFNEEEKYTLRGKIFNAIKAPEICFETYGLPRTNVNSIRFAVNCAYGFKLPYHQNIHYQSFYENDPQYGIVIERNIYK